MRLVVELRNGWRSGGNVERRLAVHPLTGRDEMALSEAGRLSPAAWGNRLLAACASDPATDVPIGLALVRQLSVGDRERLLLAAYAVSFAREADMVLDCQAERCGETIELTLDLAEFLAPRDASPAEEPLLLRLAGGAEEVRFRLPAAGDLEAVADLARTDPGAAADALVSRCLLDQAAVESRSIGSPLRAALDGEVSRRDPDAEIRLAVGCPVCGATTLALLDAGAVLKVRCDTGDGIIAEVGQLASAYHWAEAEILALPRQRRRHYLDLVERGKIRP